MIKAPMNTDARTEIGAALISAADVVLNADPLDGAALEQAMLEAALAIVWMRKLPGGAEAREGLYGRAKAEYTRRTGKNWREE